MSQIWTKEMVDAFKPDFVAPLVGYLASGDCETTGDLFEVSGGWAAQVRWERSGGVRPFRTHTTPFMQSWLILSLPLGLTSTGSLTTNL